MSWPWYWDWYWSFAISFTGVIAFFAGYYEHKYMIESITNSRTYKIKAPEISVHALYFTIVGLDKPIAFFLNSKGMENLHWALPLMTSYSKQLKNGVPIENIIKDMQAAFDPKGSYIIPDGTGRKVNSLTHHFGIILEEHIHNCKAKKKITEEIEDAKR